MEPEQLVPVIPNQPPVDLKTKILAFVQAHYTIIIFTIGAVMLLEIVIGSLVLRNVQAKALPRRTTTQAPVATATPQPNQAGFTVSPNTNETLVGKTVVTTLTLATLNNRVDGATAVISYDPNVLKFAKVDNGTIFKEYLKAKVDAKTGTIRLTGIADLTSTFTGTGTFAKLTFIAKKAGTSKIGFVRADNASQTSIAAQGKQVLGQLTDTQVIVK